MKLTSEIIQKRLPKLATRLIEEKIVTSQEPVTGVHLNSGSTPARYTQLVEDLNNSPPHMAPRIIANHRDQGAVLSKREERIIIRIRGE